MINYGKFIIDFFKKDEKPSFLMYQPIQICNSGQNIVVQNAVLHTIFQGHIPWTTSRLLHVLSLIRYTKQVHTGAIITSLYNTHVNRLSNQIKSNQILFKVGNVHLKKRKISKKLFTRLYTITNKNKLYI